MLYFTNLKMETDFTGKFTEPLLTPDKLAEYLGISRTTVYRLVEKRVIPFYKIRGSLRFKSEEVMEYVKKSRVESADEKYEYTKTRK